LPGKGREGIKGKKTNPKKKVKGNYTYKGAPLGKKGKTYHEQRRKRKSLKY